MELGEGDGMRWKVKGEEKRGYGDRKRTEYIQKYFIL